MLKMQRQKQKRKEKQTPPSFQPTPARLPPHKYLQSSHCFETTVLLVDLPFRGSGPEPPPVASEVPARVWWLESLAPSAAPPLNSPLHQPVIGAFLAQQLRVGPSSTTFPLPAPHSTVCIRWAISSTARLLQFITSPWTCGRNKGWDTIMGLLQALLCPSNSPVSRELDWHRA